MLKQQQHLIANTRSAVAAAVVEIAVAVIAKTTLCTVAPC